MLTKHRDKEGNTYFIIAMETSHIANYILMRLKPHMEVFNQEDIPEEIRELLELDEPDDIDDLDSVLESLYPYIAELFMREELGVTIEVKEYIEHLTKREKFTPELLQSIRSKGKKSLRVKYLPLWANEPYHDEY